MKLKKVLISFVLLLTYTYGFAHNLVPHDNECVFLENGQCSDELTVTINHTHYYNVENEDDHEDHSHVVHEDHFDESFIDYLICIFNDIEHSESECYVFNTTNEKSINSPYEAIKLLVVIKTFFLVEYIDSPKLSHLSNEEIIFSIPQTVQHLRRGPPSISC